MELYVDQPRRLERAAADEPSRPPTSRRPGRPRGRRSRSRRTAPARRRSTSSAPTASGCRRLTSEPYADRRDMVAGAVQRSRVHRPHRPRQRHQDHESGDAGSAADYVRRRHEREPVLGAERTASRVHLDPLGQDADFHRRPRRQEPEAAHANRQQLPARLVE